ncbi:energy-coupling factor ABC transporter ATP-binding protein [Camelliibacillus cellulosilyticus]|uniref:Energy-coupling factor ABC transporter ATP-binding protein n=1 Tax=Camelliibacillus cellulosilyticus TaxID=2174486 RepID=A0ABV9GQK8_9BACL
MNQEKIIEGQDLSFRYEGQEEWTLKDLSFEVFAGEWLAIIGHNGSGKSTLAKCLNGLLIPEKGQLKVGGLDVRDEQHLWDVRRQVGMVFQNPDNQFVGTTVQDDVAFGMENHGIPREEMTKRLDHALKLVQMEDAREREPHRLSGGQKQRVAIAGIIALKPSIIVLDEATSMLDPQGREEVLAIMRDLNQKQGITVISITHDLDEASEADRIFVMERGEMIRAGRPREVFRDPDFLIDIGLDLPFTIKLRERLIAKRVPISHDAFMQTELVDELWKLKSNI